MSTDEITSSTRLGFIGYLGSRIARRLLLSRNLRLVDTLRLVGRRHKASPGEVAIAWTLKNLTVTAAIVGVRDAQQARGIAGAAELDLTPAEVTEIEDRIVRQAA